MADIVRDPFIGVGQPEALKHILTGAWSRHTDEANRLVYFVTDEYIVVLQPESTTNDWSRSMIVESVIGIEVVEDDLTEEGEPLRLRFLRCYGAGLRRDEEQPELVEDGTPVARVRSGGRPVGPARANTRVC